jgi:hypothetical protein
MNEHKTKDLPTHGKRTMRNGTSDRLQPTSVQHGTQPSTTQASTQYSVRNVKTQLEIKITNRKNKIQLACDRITL